MICSDAVKCPLLVFVAESLTQHIVLTFYSSYCTKTFWAQASLSNQIKCPLYVLVSILRRGDF